MTIPWLRGSSSSRSENKLICSVSDTGSQLTPLGRGQVRMGGQITVPLSEPLCLSFQWNSDSTARAIAARSGSFRIPEKERDRLAATIGGPRALTRKASQVAILSSSEDPTPRSPKRAASFKSTGSFRATRKVVEPPTAPVSALSFITDLLPSPMPGFHTALTLMEESISYSAQCRAGQDLIHAYDAAVRTRLVKDRERQKRQIQLAEEKARRATIRNPLEESILSRRASLLSKKDSSSMLLPSSHTRTPKASATASAPADVRKRGSDTERQPTSPRHRRAKTPANTKGAFGTTSLNSSVVFSDGDDEVTPKHRKKPVAVRVNPSGAQDYQQDVVTPIHRPKRSPHGGDQSNSSSIFNQPPETKQSPSPTHGDRHSPLAPFDGSCSRSPRDGDFLLPQTTFMEEEESEDLEEPTELLLETLMSHFEDRLQDQVVLKFQALLEEDEIRRLEKLEERTPPPYRRGTKPGLPQQLRRRVTTASTRSVETHQDLRARSSSPDGLRSRRSTIRRPLSPSTSSLSTSAAPSASRQRSLPRNNSFVQKRVNEYKSAVAVAFTESPTRRATESTSILQGSTSTAEVPLNREKQTKISKEVCNALQEAVAERILHGKPASRVRR